MWVLNGVSLLRESEASYSMPAVLRLSKGRLVVLDYEDYLALRAWKWHFLSGGNRNKPDYGYATRSAKKNEPYSGRLLLMHRVIMQTPSHLVCDHINGDPLDNRRANLRNVTQSQNLKNRSAFSNSQGRHKGVSYNPKKGKWTTKVQLYFETEEEALAMYRRIQEVTHGEFQRDACLSAPSVLTDAEKEQIWESMRQEQRSNAQLLDDCL